jgi:hypothetical protein
MVVAASFVVVCNGQNSNPNEDNVVSNKPSFGGPKSASSDASVAPTMAPSRGAPPAVAPIVIDGIRYEQVMDAKVDDQPQRTGYLAAVKADTDEQLWLLRVYELTHVDNLEQDVQDVFFKSMSIEPSTGQLLIENEQGQTFSVDVVNRTVTPK